MTLSDKGKFQLEEIKENETDKKIAKIINKKILKGKKVQINLSDGRNFISDIKCSTNDSVLIDLKEGKIEKCLPLKEKSKVIIFAGKHSGERGSIEKLDLEKKMAKVSEGKKTANILIKQLMVVE
jgi:small subunit ribosomal protein S4e